MGDFGASFTFLESQFPYLYNGSNNNNSNHSNTYLVG